MFRFVQSGHICFGLILLTSTDTKYGHTCELSYCLILIVCQREGFLGKGLVFLCHVSLIKKVFLHLKHIIYDFGFQKISIGKFMLILNLFIICQAAINDTS